MTYTPAIDAEFPREAEAIEEAATRAAERVARERAKLLRPDGTRTYGDAEHAERDAAILEAAAAAFDADAARYLTLADRERERAEAEFARLDGADGWERLTEAERQAAATRREFVREDVERLAPAEVERRARASLAAGDKAACWLWARYLRPQVEAGRGAGLGGVLGELDAALGMDASERHAKRRELERRIEATKSLRGRVQMGRQRVDGTHERMVANMRAQYGALV